MMTECYQPGPCTVSCPVFALAKSTNVARKNGCAKLCQADPAAVSPYLLHTGCPAEAGLCPGLCQATNRRPLATFLSCSQHGLGWPCHPKFCWRYSASFFQATQRLSKGRYPTHQFVMESGMAGARTLRPLAEDTPVQILFS